MNLIRQDLMECPHRRELIAKMSFRVPERRGTIMLQLFGTFATTFL